MAYSPDTIIEQYIAASLIKGDFLTGKEIENSSIVKCTIPTIHNHFGSLSKLRFACMCEMALWGSTDINEFMEKYDIKVEHDRNHPRYYRRL